MNDLYEYPLNDYRCFIEHHGILGQKWGVQNGPPYPLSEKDHSASERKAGWKDSLGTRVNDVHGSSRGSGSKSAVERAKKVASSVASGVSRLSEEHKKKVKQRQRVENLAKARAAKAEKKRSEAEEKARLEEQNRQRAAEEAEKERVLKTGTIKEILKYSGQVDNAVLANALQNRINYEQKIDTINKNRVSKFEAVVDKAYKLGVLATKVSDTASNINKSYKNVKGVLEDVGLLEKKRAKSYNNIYEIKDDIYNKILSGKIGPNDYANYSKAVAGLDALNASYKKSEQELNKTYSELIGAKPSDKPSTSSDGKRASETLSQKEEKNEKEREKKRKEEKIINDYDKWRNYV